MSDTLPTEGADTLGMLEGMPGLGDFQLHSNEKKSKLDIDRLDQAGLLHLRAQIDAKIVGTSLSEVNLVKETLIQLQFAKVLQADAGKTINSVPMNQRAQVQNSIAAILDKLTRIQATLYSAEYTKRLQATLVKVLRTLPHETQVMFFEMLDLEAVELKAEMGDTNV